MPYESDPHQTTWIAFVTNDYICSKKQIPAVKANLALIASTIANCEPVFMLVEKSDPTHAKQLLGNINKQRFPITL